MRSTAMTLDSLAPGRRRRVSTLMFSLSSLLLSAAVVVTVWPSGRRSSAELDWVGASCILVDPHETEARKQSAATRVFHAIRKGIPLADRGDINRLRALASGATTTRRRAMTVDSWDGVSADRVGIELEAAISCLRVAMWESPPDLRAFLQQQCETLLGLLR